jgi:DNA-binding MarR family transcriptional regulator
MVPAIPANGEGMRGEKGHLPYLLGQAHGAVRAGLERSFADLKVTVPQFAALTMVDAYGGLSCADLARLTNLTAQTINPILKRLEESGLISKSADPVHGRIIRLFITPAGHRLRRKCRARADRLESRLAAGLGKDEEKALRKWLVQVAADLNKYKK